MRLIKTCQTGGLMCYLYAQLASKKVLSKGRNCLALHIEFQSSFSFRTNTANQCQITASLILELKIKPAICSVQGLNWTTSIPGSVQEGTLLYSWLPVSTLWREEARPGGRSCQLVSCLPLLITLAVEQFAE